MKPVLSALALAALLAGPASAGALSDPIVENDVIVADTTAGSSASGVPLVLFMAALLFAVAAD